MVYVDDGNLEKSVPLEEIDAWQMLGKCLDAVAVLACDAWKVMEDFADQGIIRYQDVSRDVSR